MKFRTGFVSNSSSSSFICGEGITKEQAISFMQKIISTNEENDFFDSLTEDDYYIIELDKYTTKDYGERFKNFVGRVLIMSTDDNSIPSDVHSLIENKLNAEYFHGVY
jgi:hypothetical protein